ncbi:hypothetical protein BgAZ_300180 [Babesia gibsoni]|uniref:Uncharacterized protein n=1 Tax=Babesia gibsoni TaxID=33632 RepID=A0AAD8P8F5_BABGI|nr:hypothetical protein BgAZ_300180 [Babesia gibsoni]
MGVKPDPVGANIKALQSRVCIEYAAKIGRFPQRYIEREHHILRTVDVASSYTLIPPMTIHGFYPCDASPAVFTMMEQRPSKKKQGVIQSPTLLVCIKCEYVNIKNEVTKYLFQVVADHDACNYGYFHQMHVNQDASMLLLVSPSAAYVARIPCEIDDASVIADDVTGTFIYKEILPAEVLLSRKPLAMRRTARKIIKVEFHGQYNNTICMLTVERLEEQATSENPPKPYDADDPNAPDENVVLFDPNKQSKMGSVIRIFNVDESLDVPYLEFHLSAHMCRTGQGGVAHTNDVPQGVAVDFCWHGREQSTWGASTLFVLSNYGFLFAYCPILLPECLNTFSRRKEIVIDATALLSEGYCMKNMESTTAIKKEKDITELLSCLTLSQRKHEVEGGKESKDAVTITPHVFKLETSDTQVKSQFDAFTLMSSHRELVIVSAALNGCIMLFKTDALITPRTSHFGKRNETSEITIMVCAHASRSRRAQFGSKVNFVTVSDVMCIAHSSLETIILRIGEGNLELKSMVQARRADDYVYYQSHPLVVTGTGHKSTNEAFTRCWHDPHQSIYVVQATSCYLKSQEELKHLALSITPIPSKDETVAKVKLNDPPLKGLETTETSTIGSAIINFSTTVGGDPSKLEIAKLKQRASNAESASKQSFSKAGELVGANISYKDKTVGLVKSISRLDSDVVLQLKVQKHIESAVVQSVQLYSEIAFHAQKVFGSTGEYVKRLQAMKDRVQRLQQASREIEERERRVVALKAELAKLMVRELTFIKITDLVTKTYLRWSNKICKSIMSNVAKAEKLNEHKDCVKAVVDEWLADAFRKNVEEMENTFRRIQSLRNRTLELK